jgi:hypothetical protein
MSTASSTAPRRYPGRVLLTLGLMVAVAGVVSYAVQIWAEHLATPWYLPIVGTLGLVCVVVSLCQARSIWRLLALILVLLLTGGEWAMLLGGRQPPYAGPVAVDRPFPAFATLRADGTPFTQRDLEGEHDNVLVFFRGRW